MGYLRYKKPMSLAEATAASGPMRVAEASLAE
jgi:hypothetical protein